MKSKIAQNLSYRFFEKIGSKRDSLQQINCENFIIGCTVGFRAILDQRQVFTTLDENCIAHALCSSAREKSIVNFMLFYRLFMHLFCHLLLALGLNTCLKAVQAIITFIEVTKCLSSTKDVFVF